MEEINRISGIIVDCAYHIHAKLGIGLLESVYHEVLCRDLARRALFVESKKSIAINYDGIIIEDAFRPDLIVEKSVVVEIKSIAALAPVHEKQLLTYLRLLNYKVGLLINFNTPLFRDGIKRMKNGY